MIGGNIVEFGLTDKRELKDFYNIIPEKGGSGCGACGMARTLEPVMNTDSSCCQVKQQVTGLEPKWDSFKDHELRDR